MFLQTISNVSDHSEGKNQAGVNSLQAKIMIELFLVTLKSDRAKEEATGANITRFYVLQHH